MFPLRLNIFLLCFYFGQESRSRFIGSGLELAQFSLGGHQLSIECLGQNRPDLLLKTSPIGFLKFTSSIPGCLERNANQSSSVTPTKPFICCLKGSQFTQKTSHRINPMIINPYYYPLFAADRFDLLRYDTYFQWKLYMYN